MAARVKLSAEINWHTEQERDNARLAARYVKDKDYGQAAHWYRSANFHQQMALALGRIRGKPVTHEET